MLLLGFLDQLILVAMRRKFGLEERLLDSNEQACPFCTADFLPGETVGHFPWSLTLKNCKMFCRVQALERIWVPTSYVPGVESSLQQPQQQWHPVLPQGLSFWLVWQVHHINPSLKKNHKTKSVDNFVLFSDRLCVLFATRSSVGLQSWMLSVFYLKHLAIPYISFPRVKVGDNKRIRF